jgi:hypothetical protein
MYSKILPTEIILEIYEYCDVETRIKLNSLMKWSYYSMNPYNGVKIFGRKHNSRVISGICKDGQLSMNIIMHVKLPEKNIPMKWCL